MTCGPEEWLSTTEPGLSADSALLAADAAPDALIGWQASGQIAIRLRGAHLACAGRRWHHEDMPEAWVMKRARWLVRTIAFARPCAGILGGMLALMCAAAGAQSLRFHGNGFSAPTVDRVVIALDAPARPVDVGSGDFTLEFWLRALPGENDDDAGVCDGDNDRWIYGHIMFDRDVDGPGDHGDYGVSLINRRLVFGVSRGSSGAAACGASIVDDGQWHHLAFIRHAGNGALQIFVDGQFDGSAIGPLGDVSYRDGRSTSAVYDPTLVIGAEKHDYQTLSFAGWISEVRLSTVVRYNGAFTRPSAPFVTDVGTAALYHFDEDAGSVIHDTSNAVGGPSHGELRYGGDPAGPQWSPQSPFDAIFLDDFEQAPPP